jgi:hypothetical protein
LTWPVRVSDGVPCLRGEVAGMDSLGRKSTGKLEVACLPRTCRRQDVSLEFGGIS